MQTFLVIAAGAGFAAWILWPLFTPSETVPAPEQDHHLQELMEQKASVYRTIIDLEADLGTGKLDPDDFQSLNSQSRVEALGLIQQIEAAAPASAPGAGDRALEQEIQLARERLRRQ